MVYSDKGLNGMSQAYHRLYRDRLMRGKWRNHARPILLNNWEATYFDFDEEKILNIAKKAKEVGVELFVLDDGWFGTRNDDYQGLGDWFVNKNKLPNGISGLSRKIEEMGLKFGLWVELEMVNKNSDCYRAIRTGSSEHRTVLSPTQDISTFLIFPDLRLWILFMIPSPRLSRNLPFPTLNGI